MSRATGQLVGPQKHRPKLCEHEIPAKECHVVPCSSRDLSPQERVVAQLISDGLKNATIAYRLGITEYTVKNHVTSILRKLDMESRTQVAVWWALRNVA